MKRGKEDWATKRARRAMLWPYVDCVWGDNLSAEDYEDIVSRIARAIRAAERRGYTRGVETLARRSQ